MAKRSNRITMHTGIPRTAAEAVKQGFKRITVDFSAMDDDEKANWVPIGKARAGAVALVRPPKSRTFAGPDGTFIVCYYNEKENRYNLNCHEIPADQVTSPHLTAQDPAEKGQG
jgi:hypothetical protein